STASKEVYGTYLGGSGSDQGNGIAVDSSGDAWIAGYTQSSNFPVDNPVQLLLGITGGSNCGTTLCADAFVTELNPAGSGLLFSTFLGGSSADFGQAIALDSSGDAYITGSTLSSNFPTMVSAYQAALGGVAGNAFVGEIEPANAPGLTVSPAKLNFGNETITVTSAAQPITVVNEGTKPLSISSITTTTDFKETDNCVGTVAASGGNCTINVTYTPPAAGSDTGQLTLTDNVNDGTGNVNNSPQTITLTGTGVTQSSALTVAPTSVTFGNTKVGTLSAPQSVTLTNTGSSTIDITAISVSTNFEETNTCLALGNVLNVGQSCSVSITFGPTGSGALSGSLTVTDSATGSPQTVALAGTGTALFSLSSSAPTKTTLIGNTTATFTVTATAASGFSGSILLSCVTTSSCAFSPTAIVSGQSSTLTVSNLSASTPNPYNFYVQGTSGGQSTTVPLTLLLETYSLSASPLLDTIVAGGSAGYTIVVTPLNGYNQELTLTCSSGLPSGARCDFSSPTVIPNGKSPSTVSLTIVTTTQVSVWNFWSGHKPPPRWMLIVAGVWLIFALGLFIKGDWLAQQYRGRRACTFIRITSRAFTFGFLVVLLLLFASCRGVGSGAPTPSGDFFVTVTGTMNANTNVVENTVVDLAVTPTT
ncbi:MAG: choice-of-anchor D domain-containing protein, partial [Terriglobia bacterium]